MATISVSRRALAFIGLSGYPPCSHVRCSAPAPYRTSTGSAWCINHYNHFLAVRVAERLTRPRGFPTQDAYEASGLYATVAYIKRASEEEVQAMLRVAPKDLLDTVQW